nr:MAG TPA: hypothetical protein [Caudoviricetes sp.]
MKLYFVFNSYDCAYHFSVVISSCVFRPYLVSAVCVAIICYWECHSLDNYSTYHSIAPFCLKNR